MKRLPNPDDHHLRAAEGCMGLGNHMEANEELEKISPKHRGHPHVLELRWGSYAKAKKWEECVDIASALVKVVPKFSGGWIHRSYALHELQRTQEAYDLLLPAVDEFPRIYTVPYNLACYCSRLGKFEEAQEWFKKAMAIDEKAVQEMSLDDPDLKPLWDSMRGSLWAKGEYET